MISPTLSIVLIVLFSSFILATLIIQYFEQKQAIQSQTHYYPIKKMLTSRKAQKWYKQRPQALELFNQIFPDFDQYILYLQVLADKETEITLNPFTNEEEKEEERKGLFKEWALNNGVAFDAFTGDMSLMLYEVYGIDPNFEK